MVSDGTEFAVGDIEKLFDEARRNTMAKHEKYNIDETVMPNTISYNLRPRRSTKVESRPANEKRTQQGGLVRSRGSREKQQYRP
ncbi:hypothetical protein TNCV_2177561 [Trichonephila clavipes]|uniref:Uncharacterized protein n=1 Tax=Trichonephila clavipes TaxID=2585209 RepID=A0A8X6VU63_TRICX|nr:hypothetical protein TNCV_2177561 [Trichonephila clavipes]